MSDKLDDLLISFIKDIIKVFPEYKDRLNKYYSPILKSEEGENKDRLLSEFMENIEAICKNVSKDDLDLFEKDPIILQNVSFKVIWKSDISNETKKSIWKYLQSFCIYNINNSDDNIDEVIKALQNHEKVDDKEILNKVKQFKSLSESLRSNAINEKIDEKGGDHLNDMEKVLEHSSIGQIAKQVTEELDIDGMLQGENGEGGLENLMMGDNMMNIFYSISGKINMQGNNPDILKEAMSITSNMQDSPLFSNLMSGMGMENVGNTEESTPPQDLSKVNMDNRRISLNNQHSGNAVRERLQKKLKNKKEIANINKKD